MSSLYFRQIPVGPMENFAYAIGSTATRECVLVDPAWDVRGLLDLLDADGMTLVGALVTHYHPDHCGGSIFGFGAEGLPELMTQRPVPVYCNEHEAKGLEVVTKLSRSDFRAKSGGDTVDVGGVSIKLLHTPGHTPGSQCFLVDNRLVAGDTLFLQGCGRVDLPGGSTEEMYRTLTQRLATLPDDTLLYPGHSYGDADASDDEFRAQLGAVRRTNAYLQVKSLEDWLRVR